MVEEVVNLQSNETASDLLIPFLHYWCHFHLFVQVDPEEVLLQVVVEVFLQWVVEWD